MRALFVLLLSLSSCLGSLQKGAIPAYASALPEQSITIGDVDAESMFRLVEDFSKLENDASVVININSFGGSVWAGLEALDIVLPIKHERNVKTVCVVGTKAMSMGLYLLESDLCDVRLARRDSMFLAHNVSSQLKGTAKEIERGLEFLRVLDYSLSEVICLRMTISCSDYRDKIDGKDWVFTSKEALEVGAIDGVIDNRSY